MTDQRLSNLTIMAIERDVRVDYERVIDRFPIIIRTTDFYYAK